MTNIQDNKINFIICDLANERKYSLLSGKFYIKERKIASGQPCEIADEDTLNLSDNGELNFRVGQNASSEVSQWFNEQCNPITNTTLGHSVTRLNFAFLGTLKLKILQESVNRQFKVKIKDILIGQESSGPSNNWWFGGKTCSKISNDKIVANGSTNDRNNFRFTFSCGSNTVEIVNIEYFTWMKMIDDNKFLSQINIPSTHDSGTSKLNLEDVRDYMRTQNLTIREQLDFGIRFLDIRCRHINNTFAIHHDKYYCNLMFDEVLQQCLSFLQENESECIVMLIKEEYNPEGNTREFYQTFLKYVNDSGGLANWYAGNTIPRLKDVRKKIVLLQRFNFKEQSFGINVSNWPDNRTFKIVINNDSKAFWVQDEYSVTLTQKSAAINDLINESKKRENFWYLNYASLAATSDNRPATIKSLANHTNGIIYEVATNNQSGFLGSIMMDYPNLKEGLTARIIDNNCA